MAHPAAPPSNRLAREPSPYLRQHAQNPVDWYPWGDEALALARREHRPILLSVGYSACHWCHVMAHESFEDAETARLMNACFVNVKVDREERPDLDQIYQGVVQLMGQGGGWPLTVFLTPDLRPFYGGTYFPPEDRYGRPGFKKLLEALHQAWTTKPQEIEQQAASFREGLGELATYGLEAQASALQPQDITAAGAAMLGRVDPVHGGFGRAPKFPNPMNVALLLRAWRRSRDVALRDAALRTLEKMALGGLYDQLGGGFHRYSVDERWLVPHFEKMLYDNALLVPAYLHGWLVTGRERYREVVEETVEYLLRDLKLPNGGFASSQDADTDGVEGLTYTWAPGEGAPEELLEPFEDGRFVLRGSLAAETRARLLELRSLRPQPGLDDKAIASWNGLALGALAEAGRRLGRAEWVDEARALAEFLLGSLSDGRGRLYRSLRDGRTSGTGFLDDYANVAHGLYELHVATGELRWLEEARRLALLAVELFADEADGGFFLAPSDAEQLVARKKDLFDHPVPSGNSMLAYVLLLLARIYGDDGLERGAVGVLRLLGESMARGPTEFAWALNALDLYLATPREIAVVGPPDSEVARAALEAFDPNAVVAFGPAEGVPLLEGKDYADGRPAVYVCERFACQRPVTDASELQSA